MNLESIKNAIKKIEEMECDFLKKSDTYIDEEHTTHSNEWLKTHWQFSLDIRRLEELMFDYKYNRPTISVERVEKLSDWLNRKYEVIL